jgi:hypothetical protein
MDQNQNKDQNKEQNKCNVCNQSFNSEQELREHQRNAHGSSKKEQDRPGQDRPGSEQNPDRGEKKIAS